MPRLEYIGGISPVRVVGIEVSTGDVIDVSAVTAGYAGTGPDDMGEGLLAQTDNWTLIEEGSDNG